MKIVKFSLNKTELCIKIVCMSNSPVIAFFFLVMANTIIATAARVKTAVTTMTVAPIVTPITHLDTCKAAALSSIGDVGAE